MRDTVVISDDYAYGKPPAGTSIVRTLLCGAPLFADPKRRPSNKLKSTQFCSYTPLPTCFKPDEMEIAAQQPSGAANSTYKNQMSVLVAKHQNGCSTGRSSVKHHFPYGEQKRSASMFEMDHRPRMDSFFYGPDQAQEYYEKLICQLTMSNSALMRENQRYQIRFEHLKMLLEDHIDHLNNIYFTLFLNGFNTLQFPNGQTVNLAEFQGTELKLIPRTSRLPVDISPTTPDEDLFTPLSHNNDGSFADISVTRSSEEDTESEQILDNLQSEAGESSRSILSGSDDDIEGYLQWLNGQTTVR